MRNAKTGAARELHNRAGQGLAGHDTCHSVVTIEQAVDFGDVFHA
jgi:hypothetical protein